MEKTNEKTDEKNKIKDKMAYSVIGFFILCLIFNITFKGNQSCVYSCVGCVSRTEYVIDALIPSGAFILIMFTLIYLILGVFNYVLGE